jgi:hypothetical protein
MTGPEHYANAESDLDNAAHASDKRNQADVAYWLGCAQVHATLALAAATALIDEKPRSGSFDAWREWQDVSGPANSEYSRTGEGITGLQWDNLGHGGAS